MVLRPTETEANTFTTCHILPMVNPSSDHLQSLAKKGEESQSPFAFLRHTSFQSWAKKCKVTLCICVSVQMKFSKEVQSDFALSRMASQRNTKFL